MTKKVITTVGTSVFTNLIRDKKGDYSTVDSYYNLLEKDDSSKWENRLNEGILKELRKATEDGINGNPNASAEIKSSIAIANDLKEDIEVHLITTDSVLGRLACEIISEWFKDYKTDKGFGITATFNENEDVIKSLQVYDAFEFRNQGLKLLLNRFKDILYQEEFAPFLFLNITGGYKALIPYLTILGQINEVKICYIFEDTDKLIWFPQIPINIDYSVFQLYYDSFTELVDKGTIEGSWASFKQEKFLPDSFDNFIDREEINHQELYAINAIGEYYFDRFNNYIILEIIKGSSIFSESSGNKKQILDSIRELHNRVIQEVASNKVVSQENLISHIVGLGGKNDLRHGDNPKNNIFIFKSTDVAQIRIVYTPILEKGTLSIKIYDYKRGNFDHSSYIKEFGNKYKLKNEFEFSKISIKKL